MVIQRGQYVSELLSKRWNGKVKIITGIRRCGKSFLLFTLYKNYLQKEGVSDDCFIELALDKKAHIKYRNPNELYNFVLKKSQDANKHYYVFIDEIQLSYKVKNDELFIGYWMTPRNLNYKFTYVSSVDSVPKGSYVRIYDNGLKFYKK